MTQATLVLRATQQTALTPRLQQSVRLLQLSSHDFIQELEQAVASNPFLEVPLPDEAHPAGVDGSAWAGTDAATRATTSEGAVADAEPSTDSGSAAIDGEPGDFAPYTEQTRSRGADDGEAGDIGEWVEAASSLRAHLRDELAAYRLGPRDRAIALLVIEALDDDGYLRQALQDAAARFAFDPPVDDDELAIALKLVQQLGPTGIGARSVVECLALQLEARRSTQPACAPTVVVDLALRIVRDHLTAFAARDWARLERTTGCSCGDLAAAADLIRSLDPHPGSAFGEEVAQSIVPDVIVRRGKAGWRADINPAVVPRVALNRVYAALLHDTRAGNRPQLDEQLQEARWLVRNAAQRFVTIRRVARVIVKEQSAFLDYGDIAIKPLLLRQVADRLELHESTISRAIGNKFMATPRGVFAFKHFFSRKLATTSGGSCSAASIRAAMRELIDGEDRCEPLSDVALARRLTEQGLCVARRTVTKYRGLMRIPAVEMRKELV